MEMDTPVHKTKKITQDIRFASQPRNQFPKKLSIRKKPVMEMRSTLEPEIGLNLKVILAENILHPNRNELKESAFVLNDMLDAIQNGESEIDQSARAKYYDEPNGVKTRKPKMNALQSHKNMQNMET